MHKIKNKIWSLQIPPLQKRKKSEKGGFGVKSGDERFFFETGSWKFFAISLKKKNGLKPV